MVSPPTFHGGFLVINFTGLFASVHSHNFTDDRTTAYLPIDPLTDIAANEILNDTDPDELVVAQFHVYL